MKNELIMTMGEIFLLDQDLYRQRSGDEKALEQFYEQFPIESLPALTLQDYCLGYGCRDENFSWWIERGLEKALGRYMPGTAKGHLIYFKDSKGGIYMNRKIKHLAPEDALSVVTKLIHAIATCESIEQAKIIDDHDALLDKAGIIDNDLVGGPARRLRILGVYHPDWMIPINSTNHLRHFLTQFSDDMEPELPSSSMGLVQEMANLLGEVHERVDPDITPWGFSKLLYHPDLGILPSKQPARATASDSDDIDEEMEAPIPLNQILYGPPGTGKTYSTIERALDITDPTLMAETEGLKDARATRKARYDELVEAKRIGFVTFHQSFSYEDFVEGLKASTDEDGQVKYEVEDGIFKQMTGAAAASLGSMGMSAVKEKLDLKNRNIWKMSLGNTLGPDSGVYEECLEKNLILLGYGEDVDLSGVSSRDEVYEKLVEHFPDLTKSEYPVKACHYFVNNMKVGDLVVVSDGNYKFRAIGKITGDYEFITADEDWDGFYQQSRPVKWLRTFSPSLSHDQVMNKIFSQQTIYRLKPTVIDHDRVAGLLEESSDEDNAVGAKPYVLVIDEINRGNISRIFGELITLIEDTKRQGNPEALKVRLPYSKDMLSVPKNLFLIGTMNTADRSLAQIDIALRRRFVFEELMPEPTVLNKIRSFDGIQIDKMLSVMNQRIEAIYDREHTIGHTFFLSLKDDPSLAELERIFTGRILPLLEEYFFEDWEKIRLVLNDHRKGSEYAMIRPKFSESQMTQLFGSDPDYPVTMTYERNLDALASPESYIAIYDPQAVANPTTLDAS